MSDSAQFPVALDADMLRDVDARVSACRLAERNAAHSHEHAAFSQCSYECAAYLEALTALSEAHRVRAAYWSRACVPSADGGVSDADYILLRAVLLAEQYDLSQACYFESMVPG